MLKPGDTDLFRPCRLQPHCHHLLSLLSLSPSISQYFAVKFDSRVCTPLSSLGHWCCVPLGRQIVSSGYEWEGPGILGTSDENLEEGVCTSKAEYDQQQILATFLFLSRSCGKDSAMGDCQCILGRYPKRPIGFGVKTNYQKNKRLRRGLVRQSEQWNPERSRTSRTIRYIMQRIPNMSNNRWGEECQHVWTEIYSRMWAVQNQVRAINKERSVKLETLIEMDSSQKMQECTNQ